MASDGRMRRANSCRLKLLLIGWRRTPAGTDPLVLLMDKGETMNELALPKPDNSLRAGARGVYSVSAAMSVWFCLILASLLAAPVSCARSRRPGRPVAAARAAYFAVAGLSPVGARRQYAAVAGGAAGDPGRYRLSDAEPQLCLGNAGGMGYLARAGGAPPLAWRRADRRRHRRSGE